MSSTPPISFRITVSGLCAQNAANPHQVVIPMTTTSTMTSLSTAVSSTLSTSRPQSSPSATETTTPPTSSTPNATTVAVTSTSPSPTPSRSSTTTKPTTTTKRPRIPGTPYIDEIASKNVTAMLGKTAYLTCRVLDLGNKTVRYPSIRRYCLDFGEGR